MDCYIDNTRSGDGGRCGGNDPRRIVQAALIRFSPCASNSEHVVFTAEYAKYAEAAQSLFCSVKLRDSVVFQRKSAKPQSSS